MNMIEKTANRSSLGGSSHHKSSHAKDDFVSVTVRKENATEKAGIKLYMDDNGRVRVKGIAKNGIFAGASEIQVGDILLSVNGKRLHPGEGPDTLIRAISKARSTVTCVVRKPGDAADKVLPKQDVEKVADNNRVTKLPYRGLTKRKEDGSLRYMKIGEPSKSKAKLVQVTIGASKSSKDQTVGVSFAKKKNSKMVVKSISQGSIFEGTDLREGDRVLSCMDCNFREYADPAYAEMLLSKAECNVTLVVEKKESPVLEAVTEVKTERPQKIATDSGKPKRNISALSAGTETSDDSSLCSFASLSGDFDKKIDLEDKNEVLISAPKSFEMQEIGIQFRTEGKNALIVESIAPKSIFKGSSLAVGDRVLSINEKRFTKTPDPGRALLFAQRAKESVTLVVEKRNTSQNAMESSFSLDASSSNLLWQ